jgi:hypothetical protein
MWSIRLISDASMGIPWSGCGAVGKATFMLVREVSVRPDMVILERGGRCFTLFVGGCFTLFAENCQETQQEIQLINVL